MLDTLGNKIIGEKLFYGPKEKPFLAPRGVKLFQNGMVVSDTGQNRVFIWNQVPSHTYQSPDVVLGQVDFEGHGRNHGKTVSASSLHYPSGVWTDGKKMLVADAWNHRVLVWLDFPATHGQPADVVIGQPSFDTNLPNVAGLGKSPSSRSLHWPYGLWSDGRQLWIADTGNRRVLYYETIPTKSYAPADGVIGKRTFEERDYEQIDPVWPYSVKMGPKGQLAIADTQMFRIMIWHHWRDAFTQPAAVVIGQNDLNSSGQNQYGLFPSRNTLNWTYDVCFYKNGIMVNDTGNSRILGFDQIPEIHNAPADWLIGRPDFKTGSEYKETAFGTSSAIYWPFSIDVSGKLFCLADTGNHRLVFGQIQ